MQQSFVIAISIGVVVVAVGGGVGIYYAVQDPEADPVSNTTTTPITTVPTTAIPTTISETIPVSTTKSPTPVTTTASGSRPATPMTPKTAEESKYPWTPLDEYVWREDPTYHWEIMQGYPITVNDEDGDYIFYNLNVTTQTWQNSSIFSQKPLCDYGPDYGDYTGPCDCSVWSHVVGVAIPLTYLDSLSQADSNPLADSAHVLIGEGETYNKAQVYTDREPMYVAKIALATNSIGVNIRNVPFQPCVFADDPMENEYEEDSIIAWTWKHFIDNPDWKDIPLRNPMTKSVIRVLDAVQDLAWTNHQANIGRICVTGASKRGWTSWTVAAIDYERVTCTMPIMMDTINLVDTLHHHYRSLGNWTYAFLSYYQPPFQILGDLDTDAAKELFSIIDPFSYRRRYGNKLVNYVHMGNDEFFLPDDTWYYWDSIGNKPVQNFYQVCPNYSHNWAGARFDITQKTLGLYYAYMADQPLPNIYFKRWGGQTSGKVEIRSDQEILKATTWTARSVPGTRDFRYQGFDWDCEIEHQKNPDATCDVFTKYLDTDVTRWTSSPNTVSYNDKEGYYYSNYVFNLPADETLGEYFYAYYIEIEVAGPAGLSDTSVYQNHYTFSTQIGITPEKLVVEDCGVMPGTNCQQYLT